MKTQSHFPRISLWLAAVTATLLLTQTPSHADEPKPVAKPAAPATPAVEATERVSTFVIPTSLAEGRDPFFPKSTRFIVKPAISAPVTDPGPGPVVLELKALSGTAERPLAIINNRTFAEGEEQDVNTTQGKVKVLCLQIDAPGMSVKVRARGETQQLDLRKGL